MSFPGVCSSPVTAGWISKISLRPSFSVSPKSISSFVFWRDFGEKFWIGCFNHSEIDDFGK